jgi:hypothetical protein
MRKITFIIIIIHLSLIFTSLAQVRDRPKLILYCGEGCRGCKVTFDSVLSDGTVKEKLKDFNVKVIDPNLFSAIYLYLIKGIDRIPSYVLYHKNNKKTFRKKHVGFLRKEALLEFLDLDN